jgi:methylmalonyl-CoA mutase
VISVDNFDKLYHNENTFANRISQNQQILIKEEAHFDKVVDPAGGSYYIENMTNNLVENIWSLFMEIDADGGFAKYVESGKLSSEIKNSAEQKLLAVATRRLNILGTNQFPNQEEVMLSEVEKSITDDGKGLKMRRAAEQFDAIRLQTEKYEKKNGKRPLIQLISFGNLAMRKARAGFISNFFACGGYDIQESENCQSAEQADELIKNADLAILCSSDDEYLYFVKQLSDIKSQNADVLIAGNPKAISEELLQLGISDFIHVRTNVLESLAAYNNKFYEA